MNDIRRNPPKKTGPRANAGAEASEQRGKQRLSVEQLQQWEAMEYGIFLHFGMPTFTGYPPSHYRPPDFGQDSPSLYSPDKLDIDQWISVYHEYMAYVHDSRSRQ